MRSQLAVSGAVDSGTAHATALVGRYAREAPLNAEPVQHDDFRMDLGSPSRCGCTNVSGGTVHYPTFTNSRHGILTAMRQLHLSFIGLPGARLREDFVCSATPELRVVARGGPSYNSCAVAWWKSLDNLISEVQEIGSNRCLWVRIRTGPTSTPLWVCTFYLPASPDVTSGDDLA